MREAEVGRETKRTKPDDWGKREMAKYTASRFKKRDLQRIVIVGV